MRRWLSWLFTLALLGAIALLALVSWVFLSSERRMGRGYDVPVRQLEVSPAPERRDQGARLARIWGCLDCHGEDLAGGVVFDAPPITLSATNLTRGRGGVGTDYGGRDWVRAIRHGVGPDGLPLLFMPSHHYWVLSDDDVSAMIAYLESVPAVDATPAPTSVRGLGRFLFVTGRLPLVPAELIDHEAPRPVAPAPAVTAEYGEYLATGCRGCHGELLGGGPIVGAPADRPMAANLTPDERSGLGSWERDDFFRALREGRRPDGSTIDPIMPWQNTSAMTDLEIDALWTYLQAVPALSGSSESPDR